MSSTRLPALLAAALLALSTPVTADDDVMIKGAALYQEHCGACHLPPEDAEWVAPPTYAVKRHYLPAYPEEATFVDAVTNWVLFPEASYSLMPGAVKRFNVMPTLEIEEADVRTIATFIYRADIRTPDWFEKHFREGHSGLVK